MFKSKILLGDNSKLAFLSMCKMDVDYSRYKIYFRGAVTLKNAMQLTRIVEDINEQRCQNQVIKLHITSDGGDANVGLFCYDKLRLSKIPIHTYCEGWAISAASLIYMAGQQRFITEHSKLLIHQLSYENHSSQTYEQMKDNIYNSNMIMQDYKKIYLKETKISEKKLNELLKKDIFLNVEECIKWGFAHKILK